MTMHRVQSVAPALTLYMIFFTKKYKLIFTLYIITPQCHNKGSWSPSVCKKRAYLFYSIMADDYLATEAVKASETMILTYLNRAYSVPAH